MTAFVPGFAAGKLLFWTINRAHHSDIGGATYGAYNPTATSIFQEGIRITPIKLYDQGVVRQDILDMLATNTRHPRDFKGDLAAQIGSVRVGERRVNALIYLTESWKEEWKGALELWEQDGEKPVKISHESRDNIISDPLGFVAN